MKLRLIAAAILATAFALLAPTAAMAGKQNFSLENNTGYTINEVYVSPTDVNDWQEDVLGQDTLEDGQSVDISFHRSESSCIWDLKVTYEDGTTASWTKFNLCTISEISISYDEKSGKTWAHWK